MHAKTHIWITRCGVGALVCAVVLLLAGGDPPRAMEGPEVAELDALANVYDGVTFQHAMHTEVAACAACHHHTTGTPPEDPDCLTCHKTGTVKSDVACAACHKPTVAVGMVHESGRQGPDPFYHMERTGLRRAYHQCCINCHKQTGAPAGCTDCHAKRNNGGPVGQ